MSGFLLQSYTYCEGVARAKAKNFYYAFLVLPRPKRLAMCAVYAFMRECDDLSDEAGASHDRLQAWRADLDRALEGDFPEHPLWPALADTVHRFGIPRPYLDDMIAGVSSDLSFSQPRNFDELYRYCYQVASVVGLTITHIFGFRDSRALEMAEKCGIAFQLTNILRDVAEDRQNGRTYLPADLLARHATLEAALGELGARARDYYAFSRPLIGMVDRDSQGSLWALIEIYDRLLRRIERAQFQVLRVRHSVPTWEKFGILAQAWLR